MYFFTHVVEDQMRKMLFVCFPFFCFLLLSWRAKNSYPYFPISLKRNLHINKVTAVINKHPLLEKDVYLDLAHAIVFTICKTAQLNIHFLVVT